ncbi:hypothetical protein HY78_21970 [Rhizorhabdus wittichii DC-6]|nr:hypothetical protein HY78_21970 [Rhizorhabdus wittichii DC-6]
MSSPEASLLLSPLKVGGHQLPNRVVFTAHGTQWNPWTDAGSPRYIEYQRRRAANGVGMIVAEGLWVDRDATPTSMAAIAGPMARFNRAIHDTSPAIATVLQLVGAGASGSSEYYRRGDVLASFNGMPSSTDGEPTRMLSSGEIEALVENHALLARLAVDNGMDGVELLAGYGYLIHQSISPWGNGRADCWGDPLAFTRAVIDAVRAAIGPDRILGFRMPVDDDRAAFEGGGREVELAELAGRIVAGGGVDYLNPCMGSRVYAYTARTARSYRHPTGVDLPLAARLKQAIGGVVPVIGVNRVLTPEQGEEALARGDCDLVALTRAHMVDPDLLSKFRAGQSHRIRRCVGANDCGSVAFLGLPLMCFHNPELGQEAEAALVPADPARTVLVVGAGPAGLKAAEIAARRGHRVIVVEAEAEPGGQLRHLRSSSAHELHGAVDWLVGELKELGVTLRLGTRLDAAGLRAIAPDVVLLATGARRERVADIPGAAIGRVLSPIEALAGVETVAGAIVLDRIGDMEASLAAEALIRRGVAVTYVTPLDGFAPRAGYLQHLDLLPILERAGSEIVVRHEIAAIDGRRVTLTDRHGRTSERQADLIVAAQVPAPVLDLLPAIEAMGLPHHRIGDASAPRHARAAINDGDAIARLI